MVEHRVNELASYFKRLAVMQAGKIIYDGDIEAVDPDDVETLQDILTAAVNEAIKKVEADSAEEMAKKRYASYQRMAKLDWGQE